MTPYPQTVDTVRLTLRRLRRGDEDAFLSVWADQDVWQALRPSTPFNPEHGPKRFSHHLQHWEKHGFGLWLIYDRDTGDTAGWVGPSHPDYVPELRDEIEIAWSLRRPFWGHGIATEGAKAAVAAALEHLHQARLISLIDPDNLRSVAVAKRLGMRDLGSVEHSELDLQLRLYALDAPANPPDLQASLGRLLPDPTGNAPGVARGRHAGLCGRQFPKLPEDIHLRSERA